MYIHNGVSYAIELVRDGNRFMEHLNRFKNKEERPEFPVTNEQMAIARYSNIKIDAKALIDFYQSSGKISTNEFSKKFETKLGMIPSYLKDIYYLIVFYNNYKNVLILNKTTKPFRHTYNTSESEKK